MYSQFSQVPGVSRRYSPKKALQPINFICVAPQARKVSIIGDFNEWRPDAHPMKRLPDGGWHLQIPLGHGHHYYLFVIDGQRTLDARAQGTVRNAQGEKVSLVAVS